jgi:hypothetical protein
LIVVAAWGCLHASPAAAYCRVTTCNRASEDCDDDANGCARRGVPLAWNATSVRFGVASAGSILRDISGPELREAVDAALAAWSRVSCANGASAPRLEAAELDGAGTPEDSAITFYDERWPHGASSVAKTVVTFDADRGFILDADLELNAADHALAVDAGAGEVDLVAVLTHEFGHALGLDHSDVPGATMQPEPMGFGTLELRSLEADDEEGLCAIYGNSATPGPSGNTAPKGGGCSWSGMPATSGSWAGLAAFVMFTWFSTRRARARLDKSNRNSA